MVGDGLKNKITLIRDSLQKVTSSLISIQTLLFKDLRSLTFDENGTLSANLQNFLDLKYSEFIYTLITLLLKFLIHPKTFSNLFRLFHLYLRLPF